MARDLTFRLILDSLGFKKGAEQAGSALQKLSKDIKASSDGMAPLSDSMGKFGGIISKLSSPLGIATVAIGAIGTGAVLAAKGVAQLAEEAEKLQNASAKTGLGLQVLQQYQRTAVNMGMSLESVTGAINKMQRATETNSKALAASGLELAKIRGLKPEDQFEELARQIAKMDTPAQRTTAAMAAFGRAGAELLPLLVKIGSEGTDAIVTMSDQQIAALADVDDALDDFMGAWKDFQNQLFAGFAELGGPMGIGILADGFRGLAQYMKEMSASSFFQDLVSGNTLKNMIDAGGRAKLYQGKSVDNFGASVFQPGGLVTPDPMAAWKEMERAQPALDHLRKAQEEAAKAARKHATELKTLEYQLDGMAFSLEQATEILNKELLTAYDDLSDFGPGGKNDLTKDMEDLNKFLGQGPEMGFTMVGTQVTYVKEQTVEWAQELQNAANIMASMGGILGKVGTSLAGITAGIAGIQSGKQSFDVGKAQGGIGGALSMLTGGLSIVTSAIGIGKSIINLFKGDPVKKAAKEAGKALGINISKEMAQAFADESKRTGKSVSAIAKEWLETQRKELRSQGMGQMRSGVDTLLNLLGTSESITRVAAGNFATLFWETVKDEGWIAATDAFKDQFSKLKDFFGENLPPSLASLAGLMNLASNQAVAPFLQAAQAQGQFVSGAMNAGVVTGGMQKDSIDIAQDTLANLRANGATDEQAYQAIGSLLQSNVNAAIASGQGISSDLQALLDEARANNVNIIADIGVQQLDVLRAIYHQLGGIGNASTGMQPSTTGGGGAAGETGPGPTNGYGGEDYQGYRNGPDNYEPIPFAKGGIVTKPTIGLVGEAGPEAIVPLHRMTPASSITLSPTFVVDPLMSNEGRKDLSRFQIGQFLRSCRNDPLMRRMLRQNGGR